MAVNASPNSASKRLYFFAAFLFFWLMAIAFRLVQLQVVKYGDFVQRASRQQQRSIEVSPRRGVIYDRNGRELAMSVSVDSIFAVPSEIPDQATTARLVGRILRIDPADLMAKFKSSKTFTWVARKVDAEESERVRALNLRGIYFQKESKRFYPKRELGAQVLGYVGLDDEGLGGIERAFDDDLRGNAGKMLISVDARRKWFGRVEKQPEPGQNIILTIDEHIQYIAEKELARAMQETKADAGTVIVQNPHTGEILALASAPTFNPNVFHSVSPEQLKNRAVSDVYEPGSVFKIVTISAALEEKLTTPDEVIDCQMGQIVVNGMRIRDHEKLGMLTVSQILAKSSDVGAIKLGLRLGNERFDHYIRAFGFGSQTGIELPGETKGLAKPVNKWSKVSIGAISMGQEIGVSAVQVADLISTIANDGTYTPARILAGSLDAKSPLQPIAFHPPQQRRAISPLTAAQMKHMMEGVVLFGTGRKAILDGYSSAGKTGTAQKVDPDTGAYSRTKYIGSFAGFAPVNNPALTIVVILDSAQGLHQGGQVAAPVFNRVAQQVLEYMNIPHDAEIKNNPQRQLLRARARDEDLSDSSPDHLGAALDLTPEPQPGASTASTTSLATAKPAAGKITTAALHDSPPLLAPQQNVSDAQVVSVVAEKQLNGTVVLDVTGGQVVPSLLGKTLRAAVETAQDAGLEIDAIGTGVARQQSPAPGTRLPAGAKVAVRFGK